MKVIDLFCGLRGWSQPAIDAGDDVWAVDFDPQFDPDLVADIGTMSPDAAPFRPDIVLASPPCTSFSVMTIGRNWNHDHTPKHPDAELGLSLVVATRRLIAAWQPQFFVIENPRAKLRRLAPVADLERRTVTYCHYGESRMKPTDLWGGFPPSLRLHPACRNGDPCHTSAPRGSRTGTQGMDKVESAKIPYLLAADVLSAARSDLGAPAWDGRLEFTP